MRLPFFKSLLPRNNTIPKTHTMHRSKQLYQFQQQPDNPSDAPATRQHTADHNPDAALQWPGRLSIIPVSSL